MPISAVSSHTRTFGSCCIICDGIDIKPFTESPYCPWRCSQLSGYLNFAHNGMQHTNGKLTYLFVSVFPIIKGEKSNVFDFFQTTYEYAFWMKWKLNVKFRSVHCIRRTWSLNVLQMTTFNVKQFTTFDIAYYIQMIYKPIHIFVLKQIKFT